MVVRSTEIAWLDKAEAIKQAAASEGMDVFFIGLWGNEVLVGVCLFLLQFRPINLRNAIIVPTATSVTSSLM